MSFTIIYLLVIIAPGFIITQLLKIKTLPILFSVSFSLFYFIVILATSISSSFSVDHTLYSYSGGFLFLLALYLVKVKNLALKWNYEIVGYSATGVCACIYLISIGPYDELPSDIFRHLEYFKVVSAQLSQDEFKVLSGLEIFGKQAQYWYHIPALIANLLQHDLLEYFEIFATINVILLLLCIYGFSCWLYQSDIDNKFKLIILSLFSVFFFVTHFGINVFSYVRYYAIAPTILNFVVYLTSIVLLVEYLKHQINPQKFILITSCLFFTAYLLHAQEAFFIVIIYLTVMAIALLKSKFSVGISTQNNALAHLPTSLTPIFLLLTLASVVAYFYVITELPFARINKPKIIDLSLIVGLGEDNFILNPRIQFYTVLTQWGFYIYCLYIIFYEKYFGNQPVLLAGMLIPVLTVFNPIFTNFFLRIGYSDVLWRFLYMLPLYFVAARIVTRSIAQIIDTKKRILINLIIIIPIFLLLLPLRFSDVNLPYSRIYSLTGVHYQARPSYWQDMLDYLQTLPEKETIVTDAVTAYLINAMTKHHNRGYKFYSWRLQDQYDFNDYADHPLKQHDGKIFILNLRKGMSTKAAKVAQHWNPHILKLTEYYSDDLIDHLDAESTHFKLLWQVEDIKIYRINY